MGANVTLSALLAAAAVAAVPLGRRLTGDYFPPAVLVIGTWAATLALYFLHIIPYPDMAPSTFAYILAAVAAIAGGAAAGQRWATAKASPAAPVPSRPELWLAWMAVGGLVGTAWYVWAVSDVLGVRAFFDTPMQVRIALGNRSVPSRYLILQFLCMATPILAAAFALTSARIRPWVWLLVGVCTLGTWVSTDRTQFFVVVLTTYFMYVLTASTRLSYLKLAAQTLVLLVALGGYFLFIGAWLGKTPANLGVQIQIPMSEPRTELVLRSGAGRRASGTSAPPPMAGWERSLQQSLQRVSTIYLYATASYRALDVLLDNPQPKTYGVHTIYPVARLLDRLGMLPGGVPPAIAPFAPLGLTAGRDLTFNAYTFLYYPISDFGPFGALAYCLVVGAISGYAYGRFSGNRQSPLWLLAMGHLSATLVLTVFVNKFNNTATWYIVGWSLAPFVLATLIPSLAAPSTTRRT